MLRAYLDARSRGYEAPCQLQRQPRPYFRTRPRLAHRLVQPTDRPPTPSPSSPAIPTSQAAHPPWPSPTNPPACPNPLSAPEARGLIPLSRQASRTQPTLPSHRAILTKVLSIPNAEPPRRRAFNPGGDPERSPGAGSTLWNDRLGLSGTSAGMVIWTEEHARRGKMPRGDIVPDGSLPHPAMTSLKGSTAQGGSLPRPSDNTHPDPSSPQSSRSPP